MTNIHANSFTVVVNCIYMDSFIADYFHYLIECAYIEQVTKFTPRDQRSQIKGQLGTIVLYNLSAKAVSHHLHFDLYSYSMESPRVYM